MSKEYLDYTLANIANRHAEENNTELNAEYLRLQSSKVEEDTENLEKS